MLQNFSTQFAFNTLSKELVILENTELEMIKYREYLLGYDIGAIGRLQGKNGKRLPLLATPFRRHLNEVNRFLFSGGISIDIKDAIRKDPRQQWLDRMVVHMQLPNLLDTLWERGATTGEIFLAFVQNASSTGEATELFDVQVYDKTEFEAAYDNSGNLLSVTVLRVFMGEGEEYISKYQFDTLTYSWWDPVPLRKAKYGDFGEPIVQYHNYGFVPGVVIKNQVHDTNSSSRGTSEFDRAAIEMACEIAIQTVDAAESYHYFGNQMISTPDVKKVLTAIAQRVRVIPQQGEADGGKPSVLDLKAVPDSHASFVESLKENLADHLGTPIVSDRVRGDTSSLTLRLLNAPIIDTAEKKWSQYVDTGIAVLMSKMLRASAYEGVLGLVNPMKPETSEVSVSRKMPYFAMTPQEKSQALSVVSSLVELGIRPEVALSREFFTTMTEEEVNQLMQGDL